jgi:(2R)-3-sulfolactate dehydrogenase (NADP+)
MAFYGGRKPMTGTNPIAFAAPVKGRAPLVIDMSLSVAARGKIVAASKAGKPIPADWAVDAEGRPTTDASAALGGTLLPVGGVKGAALALMIEVLCGALVGGHFGWEASSLLNAEGGPPLLGQLLIAFNPLSFVGDGFADRMQLLVEAVEAEYPARLPGNRRLESRSRALVEGIKIAVPLHDEIVTLTREAKPT